MVSRRREAPGPAITVLNTCRSRPLTGHKEEKIVKESRKRKRKEKSEGKRKEKGKRKEGKKEREGKEKEK
jgi:hypothetical protein